jgi:uncharacterized protein (DUF2345 family)
MHLGAGQDHSQHSGGAWRVHSGQALSVLAGAAALPQQPGGLHLLAAQGPIELQAHSDRLEIAAQEALDIQSQSAHIDAAAAKKITLATAGGARITLQASGITVECPGTIRVQAAQKRMVGPSHIAYEMNAWPQATPFDEQYVLRWPDGSPIARRRFEITRPDGTVVRGTTDAQGATGLQKDLFANALDLKLLDEN